MELKSVHLVNFQCFKDSETIPIHKLTIFIGENDCGKTGVLRALDLFLNNKKPDAEMFHKVKESNEKKIEITLVFTIHEDAGAQIPKELVVNGEITITKEYALDGAREPDQKVIVKKHVFQREELNRIYDLKAPELKAVFKDFSLTYTTVPEAQDKLAEYVQTNFEVLPKSERLAEVKWSEISELLPLFQYYDSTSYGDPQRLVKETLDSVYRRHFYDYDGDGNETLKKDLQPKEKEIREALDKKVKEEFKTKIKSINNKVKDVSGEYTIDFAGGFTLSNMLLDLGTGMRPINNVGEGTKKRLFLAILEWDREVRIKEASRRIIKGYDEPDTSLHYGAQKEMFYTLKGLTEAAKAQVIICTHSLSMIDRAPASVINHITQKEGVSQVNYLKGHEEEDIRNFLNNVSEISGIRNSSLFFERCFLIVEGESEENALPIMYRKVTERTLSEDGVVLVNLRSNACWDSFLKLLKKNKAGSTILFLDKDTQGISSSRVTLEKLRQIGFGDSFIENNVIFIGDKEFEDAFKDEIICRCLNKYWPKVNSNLWAPTEISSIRSGNGKFSEGLRGLIEAYRSENAVTYDVFRKPEFGKHMAEVITNDEIQEVEAISGLIGKIRAIIA